ncbi:MAG: EamA family transporter [Ignavibacteriaceae bacterium]|nr:EamA family transporter [Ignavibacteriaceae bacterium]
MKEQFSVLSPHAKGIIAVVVAAILWSSGGVFIKLIELNSIQLSFFRSIFAAGVFVVIYREKVLKFDKFAIISAIFYSGVLIFFVVATKLTTSANAIFLQYTAPVYVLILEPLLLKTKFERINLVAIILCFAGMTLFFVGELQPGQLDGNLFALVSGICLAGLFLSLRKTKREHQPSAIFMGNILVALICSYSVFTPITVSTNDLLMVGFLGIFQIGIAYAIFTYGITRVEAVEASLIGMIEPVLNPVWVLIGYGERPSAWAILGGVIIILTIIARSVVLDRFRKRKLKFTVKEG